MLMIVVIKVFVLSTFKLNLTKLDQHLGSRFCGESKFCGFLLVTSTQKCWVIGKKTKILLRNMTKMRLNTKMYQSFPTHFGTIYRQTDMLFPSVHPSFILDSSLSSFSWRFSWSTLDLFLMILKYVRSLCFITWRWQSFCF